MYKKNAYRLLWGAIALSFAWSAKAQAIDDQIDTGLVKVADVLDTDIRLGEGTSRGVVDVDYPRATFLRLHMKAEGLPSDGKVVLTDRQGHVQVIDASEMTASGGDGYYAMSMDSDHVNMRVTDAGGHVLDSGYTLRVDTVDVGFRDIAEKSQTGTRAVFGEDQRRRAVCFKDSAPAAYRSSQAVARIYGHGYAGTGWRVGSQNRMLTNHHVIGNTQNPADFEVWFGYEHVNCNGDDEVIDQRSVKPRVGEDDVQPGVKVRGGSRLVGNSDLDFQLFTLDPSQFGSVERFGYLSLDVGGVPLGQVIYIPQHGGAEPRQLALFVDGGDRCRIDWTPGTVAQYRCDTFGGSSGSPVIAWNTHKVIALHNSTGGSFNQGIRINQIWPHIQPYFANGSVP